VETLSDFMKHSSTLDWLVIFLSVILILAAILLLIVLRGRKPFYPFLVLALLPLLLGLATTYLKYREVDRMLSMVESVGVEAAAAGRREAWISTYVGAAGTGAAMLIGLFGLALKKDSRA
jgi:uncharacterized membrane protein